MKKKILLAGGTGFIGTYLNNSEKAARQRLCFQVGGFGPGIGKNLKLMDSFLRH